MKIRTATFKLTNHILMSWKVIIFKAFPKYDASCVELNQKIQGVSTENKIELFNFSWKIWQSHVRPFKNILCYAYFLSLIFIRILQEFPLQFSSTKQVKILNI